MTRKIHTIRVSLTTMTSLSQIEILWCSLSLLNIVFLSVMASFYPHPPQYSMVGREGDVINSLSSSLSCAEFLSDSPSTSTSALGTAQPTQRRSVGSEKRKRGILQPWPPAQALQQTQSQVCSLNWPGIVSIRLMGFLCGVCVVSNRNSTEHTNQLLK